MNQPNSQPRVRWSEAKGKMVLVYQDCLPSGKIVEREEVPRDPDSVAFPSLRNPRRKQSW